MFGLIARGSDLLSLSGSGHIYLNNGPLSNRDIIQIHMVLGGGVIHDAILLTIDGDRFLKKTRPGLLSGALTPGQCPPTVLIGPDIFEIEQFTKPFSVARKHLIADPALEVLLHTVVERAIKQAETDP